MRLIDADAIVKCFDPNTWQGEMMIAIVNGLSTIDPVKHGEWTTLQQACNGYGVMYYYHKECEVSGSEIHKRPFPYCPNCGAKMEGKS